MESAQSDWLTLTGMDEPRSPTPSAALLGRSLIVVGLALAVNSGLGPLVLDSIDYPVTDFMMNQTIGLDAANLFVVSPVFVGLGLLARSRPTLAAALALGPTTYVAYMFVQYIAGPDHLSYPTVLLLQLGLFVAGWLLAARAWLSTQPWPADTQRSTIRGAVAVVLAAFVLLRYVPGLVGSLSNTSLTPELAGDPAMYWLILLMDLGVFVPLALIVAAGLWHGRPWGEPAFLGLLMWYALVTVAVLAMAVTLVVNDDDYASTGQLILFLVVAAVVVPYTVVVALQADRRLTARS